MMNAFVQNVKNKIAKKPVKNALKRKSKKPKKEAELDEEPGVVYIGHIPHGFYEAEMKNYFSQFGKITKLRLARSRKTGNSKGFAFIEFKSAEVAKIVAEAMNNYLFFEKLLKCEFMPADKVNPNIFKGWSGNLLSSDKNRIRHNKVKTEESLANRKTRRLERLRKLQSSLKEKDIDFNIEPFIPKDK